MDPVQQYSDPSQANIPYDLVPLPSKGMFYSKPIDKVKVTYLTAADENLLSSPNLVQSGNLIDELLRRKIIGGDIKVEEMLECDKQAVLIFLRNTSFGPTYTFNLTDPKTNKTFEYVHNLSNVSMKEFNLVADEKGEFEYVLPLTQKKVKFKFLNSQQEKELEALDEAYKGTVVPKITKKIELLIQEIEGERDKGALAQMIQGMPIKDSQEFRNYVRANEPGLDLKVTTIAPSGEEVTTYVVLGAHFFVLSSDYRQSVLDEIYYLVKFANFSHENLIRMPIYERRYYLGKLIQEYEKKKEEADKMKNNQQR